MDLRSLARARRRLRSSARNALELIRFGKLGEVYGASFEVVDQGEHHKLRRYHIHEEPEGAPAILLVPPLMVTSEVYDVAPDISAVAALSAAGIVPYVVDFGAPEQAEGGMKRTLDDHVRAVVRTIERVGAISGRDVHLAGYSQGGMFAYQAAAYLRTKGVRSVVTFGSPVDVHKNVPALRGELAGAIVEFVEPAVQRVVESIEGLPAALTSAAFKVVSTRKEIEQRIEFVRLLHDRRALVRREARRRFLGGEGFVAWPGPALRDFTRDFIVHNRMLSGGFVIDGRTVTLADITCPILCFWGTADEIASRASVRAIERAAPHAEVSFLEVPAGHFGIVVGTRAVKATWPAVAQWIRHCEGQGPLPTELRGSTEPMDDELDPGEVSVDLDLFLGSVSGAAKNAWRRLGDAAASATDALDAVRYQEPRLRRLAAITPASPVSAARSLAQQAAATPDATFFLWRGRAFSYADADQRVTNVARGLYACGARAGDRVLVVMRSRPSLLTMVTALNRIGAVPLVAPPDSTERALAHVVDREAPNLVASDPETADKCPRIGGRVLVLGGGGGPRALGEGLVDMEAIDPANVDMPASVTEGSGFARDLAMIMLRPGGSGELRSAPITNHRWALSAFGAAAACTLKPGDTVYSCIPLYHPTALLACVGAAIVGGTRLALDERFDADTFLTDARRAGATVVFYAGEMLRPLLATPPAKGDRTLPIRLFAGSGMRRDLARRLRERFGVSSMEFYASTSDRVVLANASGEKPGALGRPLPGSAEVAVVRCDLARGEPIKNAGGAFVLADANEQGLLAVRAESGAEWLPSRNVVVRDLDGDYWFVDSLAGFVSGVSTRETEDALYALPEIALCAAFGESGALHVSFTAAEPLGVQRLSEAFSKLPPAAWPRSVTRVARIPMTEGFRPSRAELRSLEALERFELGATGSYVAR